MSALFCTWGYCFATATGGPGAGAFGFGVAGAAVLVVMKAPEYGATWSRTDHGGTGSEVDAVEKFDWNLTRVPAKRYDTQLFKDGRDKYV